MGLFQNKKPTRNIRKSSPSTPTTKVSNYYTPTNRSSGRPKIDTNKRGASPKSTTKKTGTFSFMRNVAIVGLLVFFAYNLTYLRNEPIIVLDRETTTGRLSVYEPAIAAMLSRSVLNSNKLTLQAGTIEKKILEEFPEIENAVVSSSLVGKRPVVHLKQQDLPFTIESKGNTYIITADGVIAGEASIFTGLDKTIPIRDESGIDIKKGTRVLRSDDANFFTTSVEIMRLKSRGVELIRLTAVPREAYIKIKDLGYELRVFLDEPPETQIGTFFSAEKTLGERGEAPSTYMDLRAGEKVYWQ